ncbi:MAG: radical SAM protein [Parcubacteria group bacterium]
MITDFCNLDCRLCSQGIPLMKNKKIISLDDLKRMSKLVEPFEFHTVKICGGEPTSHPQFEKICDNLKRLFPADYYYLATNGFWLEKFINQIKVFNIIELSHYPGKNDEIFEKLAKLKIPNLAAIRKKEYQEIMDVYQENNLNKTDIYKRCPYKEIQIVQDRIYTCCNIFGQAMRQNIDLDKISVLFDENWRQNLSKIDIEPYCQRCFIDVPGPARVALYEIETGIGRWLKKNFKPLSKLIRWLKIQKRQIKSNN